MSRPSWIVIPARDEAEHVEASLIAVAVAARGVDGAVRVLLVDDGSTDDTGTRARRVFAGWTTPQLRGAVVPGRSHGVGWARRVGLDLALAQAGDEDALIATTDADSTVASSWLAVMHRRLDEGHRVIAGDVILHASCAPELASARGERLRRRLEALPAAESSAPHPHFAGASLGFASATLRDLTPLPTPPTLEDEAILAVCRRRGIPVLRDHATRVVTSARLVGRVHGGLAAALSADHLALERARPGREQPDPTSPSADLGTRP